MNSSTRNRTRRVNLFEPCQHIIDVPGGGGGDNWSIWKKISTSLGDVWKQSPSSPLYTIKISTALPGHTKHLTRLSCVSLYTAP